MKAAIRITELKMMTKALLPILSITNPNIGLAKVEIKNEILERLADFVSLKPYFF